MHATKSQPKTRAEGERQLAKSLEQMKSGCDPDALGIPITEVGVGQFRFITDDRIPGRVLWSRHQPGQQLVWTPRADCLHSDGPHLYAPPRPRANKLGPSSC